MPAGQKVNKMYIALRQLIPALLIDKVISQGKPIIKQEGIYINQQAIKIHDYFIRITTDDPKITGDDEVHQEWIAFYKGSINLIKYGQDVLLTFNDAIERYLCDAEIHLWYMKHPEYIARHPQVGDYWHHQKWAVRWYALVDLMRRLKG